MQIELKFIKSSQQRLILIFEEYKTLDDVINKLQEVIRELDWSILKPIVNRQWLKNT